MDEAMKRAAIAICTLLLGCDDSGSSGDAGPATSSDVPAEKVALEAWLKARSYASWKKESAPHASEGPHGDAVRTYVNPVLDGSLARGDAEHPTGAAAVKELIRADDIVGWAASVKTDQGKSGDGWFWLEITDAKMGTATLSGQGEPVCKRCHAGGRDFVLSPYPLR